MLKIKDISFSYGNKTAVKSLSAEIKKSEFVGIIGPNGSGKSTLLKLLVRILNPSAGKIFLDNCDISGIPGERYAKIVSYLPSNLDIYFPYTVEEFISMGRFPFAGRYGKFNKEDRKNVRETMENFQIENWKGRSVMELSDGEKQRVFLAQGIVQQPRLLLLDEPTSHLDIGHQYRIMDAVKTLNFSGMTVISVLHDLNLASEYCTKLLLMKDGEIFSRGTPAEVITYSNIEEVYKTRVLVYDNPFSKKPHVFGIPHGLLK